MMASRAAPVRVKETNHTRYQPSSQITIASNYSVKRAEQIQKRWISTYSTDSIRAKHAPSTPILPGDPGYHLVERRMRHLRVEIEQQAQHLQRPTFDYHALRQLATEFFGDPKEFQKLPAEVRELKRRIADLQSRLQK